MKSEDPKTEAESTLFVYLKRIKSHEEAGIFGFIWSLKQENNAVNKNTRD